MKAEIKARWVDALRSAQYKQGRGALCKNGAYCCLGVLANLAVEDRVISIEPGRNEVSLVPGALAFDGEKFDLTLRVQEWAGFRHSSGPRIPKELFERDPYGIASESLITLNDVHELSFGQIADVIEFFVPAE